MVVAKGHPCLRRMILQVIVRYDHIRHEERQSMDLIFLHGPAASGKLTVARELVTLTGFRLFHNHLVVDALTAVFGFGTAPFIRLREHPYSPQEAARKICDFFSLQQSVS